MICESITPFEQKKYELWIQFPEIEAFRQEATPLYEMLKTSTGNDGVVIYCAKEKAIKRLPENQNVHLETVFLDKLYKHFGESRVKVVEKSIEKK